MTTLNYMFIQALNRELVGRELAIWTGKNEDGTPVDMPEEKRQQYITLWREAANGQRNLPKPQSFREQARAVRRGAPCGCSGKKKQNG